MPFKKHPLCTHISLIVTAGIWLAASPNAANAQLPEYSCSANAAGDGWICENTVSPARGENREALDFPPRAKEAEAPTNRVDTPDRPAQTTSNRAAASSRPSAVPTISASTSANQLDWIAVEAMSQEQRENLPASCCGAFIDPVRPGIDADANPAEAATLINTTEGLQQISQRLISIDGDVVVQQGSRTIENNGRTSIDSEANTVLMQGDIVFREPGVLLTGSSAFIDSDDNINRIETAQYVLHDYGIHGRAEALVYNSNLGMITIENGEFSRCEPETNFWLLRADEIVLDQERGRGYATSVSLRIKGVPLFYYPGTLAFPLGDERISGLLAPSTGSTRSGGFDFELPYYLNLAPNYDATVSPRLISDRGVMLSTEFRYLAEWSMNTVSSSFLADDKLFDASTANLAGSDSPPTEDRWFVGYQHAGALGKNWRTYVDYNAVSDEDYFYDLGSNGLNVTSRTHLNRQGRLSYNSDSLRAGLNVQRIQIIDPFYARSNINTPYDRLPQFYFDTDRYLPGGFKVGLSGEITSFDRSLDEELLTLTQLENGALVTGERVNLEPEISWSIEAPGWFLRANAKYKHLAYNLQNQATTTFEDPDLGIGVYSLDSGLVFERQMSGGNGGYTQTLEPRVFYLYSEFEDQSLLPLFNTSELNFSFNQLFRDDRFSGGDRIADADQVTFALTSRILDPKGKERARFSIGQITYFEDRIVSLNNPLRTWLPRYSPMTNRSALAGEFSYSFGENWRLNTDVQWDEDNQEVDEGSFQLRYQRDNDHLFNFAYRYRNLVSGPNFILPSGIDTRIKQTDASAIWPINDNWKLLARWNYDHSNSRNLETFAGLEYNNCCATIRLIGREWVDEDELFVPNIEPNRGIFVQVTLKGLGNLTGGGLSNLLSDGIWGFREPNYDQ